jgi:hypothetical protein
LSVELFLVLNGSQSMRRLALSVSAACGLALSACSGGTGLGNSSSSLSAIVFESGSSQVNSFFVAPGGTSPVTVSAVGVKGTGEFQDIVYGQTFTWTARFVNPKTDPPSIATYTTGVAPNTFKTCATPASTPPVSLLIPAGVSSNAYNYVGYSLLPAAKAAPTVYAAPVPGVAAPYCLVLTAFHPSDGTTGTVTVVVSANP